MAKQEKTNCLYCGRDTLAKSSICRRCCGDERPVKLPVKRRGGRDIEIEIETKEAIDDMIE